MGITYIYIQTYGYKFIPFASAKSDIDKGSIISLFSRKSVCSAMGMPYSDSTKLFNNSTVWPIYMVRKGLSGWGGYNRVGVVISVIIYKELNSCFIIYCDRKSVCAAMGMPYSDSTKLFNDSTVWPVVYICI
jgi:hypothetical protein